jgi:hypothetical protein
MALLAGCSGAAPPRPAEPTLDVAAVDGGSVASGGSVVDVPGYFASFSSNATQADTGGASVVTLTGSVQDNNSETDVAWIRGWVNGSSPLSVNHTVTATELLAMTEPAAFGADGFKVWTGTSSVDGLLLFRWRFTVASTWAPGVYTLQAAEGKAGLSSWSAALPLTVQKASQVTVAASPVNWTGVTQAGSWGAWNASPGATFVNATNYLKLTNVGPLLRPKVVVDFKELSFAGTTDAAYTVAIANNVDFAWWEDTTPASTAPSQGTYEWTASADGSVTLQFNGVGDVAYVTYRVKALPAVLRDQPYAATFTVTELAGDDGANAKPDLNVTSLVPSDDSLADGDTVSFTITVKNLGLAATPGTFAVTLLGDGVTLATFTVPALASGASATVTSVTYPAAKGTHSVIARADPAGAVTETVETNNDNAITLVVAKKT